MSINSLSFVICLPLLLAPLAVLQLLRKRFTAACVLQKALLLFFSLLFLILFDWRFCICILAVIAVTYSAGILMEKRKSKAPFIAGIVILIGILFYFKYFNFFLDSVRRMTGQDTVMLKIILPLGISFYVFSALSYLIDLYRKDYAPERNLLSFSLYIAFFPKLTAGPIVRGGDFFPQLHSYRGIEWSAVKAGIQIYVFGLFKKIVLADRLSVFVDDVFRAPSNFDTGTVVLAVISYSLQIYFDFSGYSDMAIGISKVLGFDFKPNFNLPYLAGNISEFWGRWHISLSTWFRDYLYFPLGGNRKGIARTCMNLMIVMLVSGLWHGAGWTFIVWGALYGTASCLHKLIVGKRKMFGPIGNVLFTFVMVSLFWVAFRADSLATAVEVWREMFTAHGGIRQPYAWSFVAMICLAVCSAAAWRNSRKRHLTDRHGKPVINGYYPVLDLAKFRNLTAFFVFCGLTVLLGYFGNTAFIYGVF